MAAKKRKGGVQVLPTMHVPPMKVRCCKCGEARLAYALEDAQTPPRYICRLCYDTLTRRQ